MTNAELLTRFFEAENKRDWNSFPGYLHPQVMWFLHTETTHSPIVGREEYVDYVATGYKNTDATFTCENMEVSSSGNRIVAFLRSSSGSRSISIFDFEDGLIRWEHEYLLD